MALASLAAVLAAPAATRAADIFWDGAVGDFHTPDNWNPDQVPAAGDNAIINNAGAAQISQDVTVIDVRAGDGSGSGTYTQTNGTVTVNEWMRLGISAAGTGTYNLHGGTLNVNNTLNVGEGGTGTL